MNESANTPPLSSYRMGQQMVQEDEAVLNYQEKIILIRRTYFMMLMSMIIMCTFQITVLLNTSIITKLNNYQAILWISLTISIIAIIFSKKTICQNSPNNIIVWIVFSVSFSIASALIIIFDNSNVCFMITCSAMAQIFAQLLSVNHVKIELTIYQSTFYVLVSALIVFQLFIVYSKIIFFKMVVIIVGSIVFGFMVALQTHANYLQSNEIIEPISKAVSIYLDVITFSLSIPSLLQQTILKQRHD